MGVLCLNKVQKITPPEAHASGVFIFLFFPPKDGPVLWWKFSFSSQKNDVKKIARNVVAGYFLT